jgi:hypothetical protein
MRATPLRFTQFVYMRDGSLKQMSHDFETPAGTIKRRLHVACNRLRWQLERGRDNPAAPSPHRQARQAELAFAD